MIIAGVDEVGRGPLAGPVIAAAVILADGCRIAGLTDSKKCSKHKREQLFETIHQHALAIAIGRAEVSEIDTLNIHHASLLAMQRAVQALTLTPSKVLVDGKYSPQLSIPCEPIIKGDMLEPAISAASIIAKVIRDREMQQLAQKYPDYGFEQHAGYPTKHHLLMLAQHGVTPIHRSSYAPVKKVLEERCK